MRGARKADRLIEGVLSAAGENLIGHASLLNALDLRLRAAEIVVTGSGERADALTAAALKLPLLNRIVLRAPSADALPASHPAREKIAAAPDGAAFVCVGERCSLPVDPVNLRPRFRRCEADQRAEAMDQQIQYCTSPDGVRLAYSIIGKGTPILRTRTGSLISIMTSKTSHQHVLLGLAHRHALVRYDPRGVGLSQRDIKDISFELWISDLERWWTPRDLTASSCSVCPKVWRQPSRMRPVIRNA